MCVSAEPVNMTWLISGCVEESIRDVGRHMDVRLAAGVGIAVSVLFVSRARARFCKYVLLACV